MERVLRALEGEMVVVHHKEQIEGILWETIVKGKFAVDGQDGYAFFTPRRVKSITVTHAGTVIVL